MMKHYIAPFIRTQNQKQLLNESDIDDVFELVCNTIISIIQKSPGQGSGWINDSVVDNNINI